MKIINQITNLLSLFIVFNSCNTKIDKEAISNFSNDIEKLKEYYQIPGMSVLILKDNKIVLEKHLGFADLDTKNLIDSSTVFPIASLTKMFSGVVLLQLADEGKLSLEDPINKYIPNLEIDDSVLVKHIASHTSQGKPGENFYYSSRFGWLTQVIEKASKKSLEQNFKERILKPLNLNDTYLLKDEETVIRQNKKFAEPYILDDELQKVTPEYGFSTSAGLVSSVRDLAKFSEALDENTLLNEKLYNTMTTALRKELPYGIGIFSQKCLNKNILWGYGQYDAYASLSIKVPSEKLTLIVLANNNLMSDSSRLIYGDISTSLFALSFLQNFILEDYKTTFLHENISDFKNYKTSILNRDVLKANALVSSFMARFNPNNFEKSRAFLEILFEKYPNYLEYGDMNLLHNLMFLKDVAFYMDLGEFNKYDDKILELAKKELIKDPNNPYVLSYLGSFYDRKGNKQKAKSYFTKIVNLENFSPNWYTQEAKQKLNN